MSRHSSAYSAHSVEAMGMHKIPSIYFRVPEPYRSRASSSHSAATAAKLSASSSMRDQYPTSHTSVSSSTSQSWEKDEYRRAPPAPMMRKRSSSGSSSYVGGSYHHYTSPSQSRPTYSPSSASTSSSSRRHSRQHSVNMGARSYDPTYEDRNSVSPNSIPHLREALSSLETQLASLMTERKRLETKLEQAVRQQSPVQHLPRELLGSIFVTGVYHMGEEDGLLLSTLMLVCKDWTEVALNTPILWSRITIDSHKSIPKARRKLARSKAVPLDISIQFGPQAEGTQPVTEIIVHALDLLRPAIWRWRSFRLAVPARAHAHTALSQCKEAAPLLEAVAVQVHQVSQPDDRRGVSTSGAARAVASLMPLFEGRLPRLRSSSFTSFNFGWDISLVSHLRVLRLGGYWNGFAPSVVTIMDVLRACPKLEELALRNLTDVETAFCPDFDGKSDQASSVVTNSMLYPKESDMVCLKRLRKASFYFAGAERMLAVFAQLIFPALERLEFSFMDNITPIIKHLKRQSFSSLPLRHLRIESCFFNELKLMRLLRHLSGLRTLELVEVEDISPSFLKVRILYPYFKMHCD